MSGSWHSLCYGTVASGAQVVAAAAHLLCVGCVAGYTMSARPRSRSQSPPRSTAAGSINSPELQAVQPEDPRDRVQQQIDALGNSHVGYAHMALPNKSISLVGARPFSKVGPAAGVQCSCPPPGVATQRVLKDMQHPYTHMQVLWHRLILSCIAAFVSSCCGTSATWSVENTSVMPVDVRG